jgi:predicted nuclease of predicted toxin-antitoxin system
VKLLLDENIPFEFRPLLMLAHDVFTVAWMRWKGIGNGQLLALAAAEGFDIVVTTDAGLEYQQNRNTLPCSVVVLSAKSNKIDDLRPLVPALLSALDGLPPRTLVVLG